MSLGQPTYLEAKAEGDNSMSVKRLRPQSVVGPVPQDPRNTVKARLLEPQFSAVIKRRPSVERLNPDANHYPELCTPSG